jgi:hypothetical protein
MLPTTFQFIWPSGFREEDFSKSANQNLGRSSIKIAHLVPIRLQIWLQQTILVSDWSISKKSSPLKPLCQMKQNFSSFGQAVSEKKIFLNRPIRNKKCLWQPCLLMDRDKMSSL